MRCDLCSALAVDASREKVKDVGPGPCVVELLDVPVLTCGVCGHVQIDVPQRHALDALLKGLRSDRSESTQTLTFHEGHWRVLPQDIENLR
jgi:hypothetical protein